MSNKSSTRIVQPVVSLLNRLPFAGKFSLIGGLFLVPLAFVAWSQWSSTSHDIAFNAKEADGVDYIQPLRKIAAALQRRGLAEMAMAADPALRSSSELKSELADANRQIDEAVAAVDVVDAILGSSLQSNARWQQVRGLVSRKPAGGVAELEASHSEALAAVNDLILNYVCNYSNLILDPDLNSYWLMDATCAKLPALGAGLLKTVGLTLQVRPDRAWGDDSFALAATRGSVLTTIGDLETVNLLAAFKDDKERTATDQLRQDLEPKMAELRQTGSQLATVAGIALQNGSTAPDALVRAGLASVREVDQFFDGVVPQLDQMIEKRVAGYTTTRTFGLLATLLAASLLLLMFGAFYRAVRDSLDSVADFTRKMIAGTTDSFSIRAQDEFAQIAEDYNRINGTLNEARRLREQVQQQNEELQGQVVDLLSVVSQASDGDLTVRAVVTAGSLGNVSDAFNTLLENLQRLLREIGRQLKQTSDTVQAVTHSSEQLMSGVGDQSRQVGEVRRMIEGMSQEISRVANAALNASEAAKRTETSAVEGASAVEHVISGMESLRANVQAGAKKMKGLGERSMEITGIVGTINRIAEQTNMLALNAAIEAARAGEHGRGFSIVADEVRKLAERSAQATVEIGRLVKTIHAETNETVNAIEVQTQVVEKESEAVGVAGEQLVRIRDVSGVSAGLVTEISSVAMKQMEETKGVVRAMDFIANIAQRAQDNASGSVAVVRQLGQLSDKLVESIGRFKL